jgi:2,5-dioxopentanoate dehydrogenase
MTSIERFLRPVCYQGFPEELLPEALQTDNPLEIWRLRDGELSLD